MSRLPKDLVKRFLLAQYLYNGKKYFNYLFGSKVANWFTNLNNEVIIETIATALMSIFLK